MDDVAGANLAKASRRVQAQQRYNKIDSHEDVTEGKQGPRMKWAKGDTQFND